MLQDFPQGMGTMHIPYNDTEYTNGDDGCTPYGQFFDTVSMPVKMVESYYDGTSAPTGDLIGPSDPGYDTHELVTAVNKNITDIIHPGITAADDWGRHAPPTQTSLHYNGTCYDTDHSALWEQDALNNNNNNHPNNNNSSNNNNNDVCGMLQHYLPINGNALPQHVTTTTINNNSMTTQSAANNNGSHFVAYFNNYNYGIDSYSNSEKDSDTDSIQSLSYVHNTFVNHENYPPVTVEEDVKIPRKRVGRPSNKEKRHKTKNGQRNGRLWEFIRDLLLDSKTCPSLLKWENKDEGIFRFVQSDKVARLWGDRKCNPRMNYEKLSRAMRYYYKSQVFLPVLGRRLVYRFGPNATGWRPVHIKP